MDFNSLPASVKGRVLVVQSGTGYEPSMSGLPVIVAADFLLPFKGVPLSIGIISGYRTTAEKERIIQHAPFALRIAYHPDFNLKKLDLYISVGTGYIFASPESCSGFFQPWCIGARFFFLKHAALFLEIGKSTAIAAGGISFCF